MNRLSLILLGLIASGCAAPASRSPANTAARRYAPAGTSALAFDPRVAPPVLPDMDRHGREPSAFLGYDDTIVEYYYVANVDSQSSDRWCDYSDRTAVSVKIGVRYR